jgi:hypothetical protein
MAYITPATIPVQLEPWFGAAGFRPQRAATIRLMNLRTAAIPLHTYPDSPGGPIPTEPPAVSACARFLYTAWGRGRVS